MRAIPTIVRTKPPLSLQDEVASLRADLEVERQARIAAESKLAFLHTEQSTDGPPPSRMAIIVGLAKLAESRDDNTGKHLSRIRHFTNLIATEVSKLHPAKLSRAEVPVICATSVLHDIGKVGVSDDILLSPNKLTNKQYDSMKRHTSIGADILISLSEQLGRDPWVDTAIQITLGHHERWDGTGYPFGLRGETNNLPARIVAVADVYDALTSKRIYKEAISHAEAVDIIKKESGTHFDPMVVEAFLSVLEKIEEVATRLQNQIT
ncbi:MAG: HD domain-containing protein [Phycisphaerales bacterium]|jgi:response regulator RpfG family c-di-GMP phosphodiesterase|nr:HD domain-containing protein [Phycisphaerales bacterium]